MSELKKRIHDESNGLDYILVGDYYIPCIALDEPVEKRPIGRWGSQHRAYLREYKPIIFAELSMSGRLFPYLAELNEQAQQRLERMVKQMCEVEGVNYDMKKADYWRYVQALSNIRNRAEEIIIREMILT